MGLVKQLIVLHHEKNYNALHVYRLNADVDKHNDIYVKQSNVTKAEVFHMGHDVIKGLRSHGDLSSLIIITEKPFTSK